MQQSIENDPRRRQEMSAIAFEVDTAYRESGSHGNTRLSSCALDALRFGLREADLV